MAAELTEAQVAGLGERRFRSCRLRVLSALRRGTHSRAGRWRNLRNTARRASLRVGEFVDGLVQEELDAGSTQG